MCLIQIGPEIERGLGLSVDKKECVLHLSVHFIPVSLFHFTSQRFLGLLCMVCECEYLFSCRFCIIERKCKLPKENTLLYTVYLITSRKLEGKLF